MEKNKGRRERGKAQRDARVGMVLLPMVVLVTCCALPPRVEPRAGLTRTVRCEGDHKVVQYTAEDGSGYATMIVWGACAKGETL